MNKDIKKLIRIAEKNDWKVALEQNDLCFSQYSDRGQDFFFYLDLTEDPKTLIRSLKDYIGSFDPTEEALKWTDPEGHGRNGAPHDFEDILADMKDCRQMMQDLLDAWKQKEIRTASAYRVIRIDYAFYADRQDEDSARESAVTAVLEAVRSHMHTVENGLRITDIQDCGEKE